MVQDKKGPSLAGGKKAGSRDVRSPVIGKTAGFAQGQITMLPLSAYNLIKPAYVSDGSGFAAECLGSPAILQTTGVL